MNLNKLMEVNEFKVLSVTMRNGKVFEGFINTCENNFFSIGSDDKDIIINMKDVSFIEEMKVERKV